jgi:hypothetical protein
VLNLKKPFSPLASVAVSVIMVLAVSAGPVQAAPQNPFMVTSALNAAVPFNLSLPSTTPDGKLLRTVIIRFVTADCDATPATAALGSAQLTVLFNGQNGFYHLGFGPAQLFPNTAEFVLTQQTLIYADPGSSVNFGITGGAPNCTVVFSGELVTK